MYQSMLVELQQRHHIAPALLSDLTTMLRQLSLPPSERAADGDMLNEETWMLSEDDVQKDIAPSTPSEAVPEHSGSILDVHVLSQRKTGLHGLRYALRGRLGVSGMGVVSRVYDPVFKREVALKVAHLELVGSDRARSRFIEEAQLQAQLSHPHLVPVYEMGVLPDGRPYFTMEIVRSDPLSTVIKALHQASVDGWSETTGGITLCRLVGALYQICLAVGHAHERGIIHRDIKPSNLMVGALGDVRVVDWGLAKVITQREPESFPDVSAPVKLDSARLPTAHGSVSGTPAYMPPEQARGAVDQLNARSDVYSLGAVLYTILSGRAPYEGHPGRTTESVLDLMQHTPPQSLSELTTLPLPEPLVAIAARAMSQDMAERYANAQEMGAALADWLDGLQRQERALQIVVEGQAMREEAAQCAQTAEQLRQEADRRMRTDHEVASCWQPLRRARQTEGRARELEHAAQRHFQGALVIDPSLPAVHHALIAGYTVMAERARQAQDERGAADAGALLEMHAQRLPSNDPWRQRLAREATRRRHWVLSARQGGPLIGRRSVLESLRSWWAGPGQLLTLVGTAGIGKTHLAEHFCQGGLDACSLVIFCDLSAARDAEDIVRQVANDLSLPLSQSDTIEQIGRALRQRGPMLLIADNLEQLIPHLSSTLGRWLRMCPELRLLATSRTRLGIDGEQVEVVVPLQRLAAVEMFETIARRSRPSFRLGAHNLASVQRIVEALDQLPLAIAFAAARMGTLGLQGVEDWLGDRFALLRGGARASSTHTLQRALEASWSLLSDREKSLLCACSAFRGGWTLEAAEAVHHIASEDVPVMDVLDALVDDHLVVKTVSEGRARFTLLESIRVFAEQKSTSAARQTHRQRHSSHYAQYGARDWLHPIHVREGAGRYAILLRERLNLMVGAEAFGEGAVRCALALAQVFEMEGPYADGCRQIHAVLQRQEPDVTILYARLLYSHGRLSQLAGEMKSAEPYFAQALRIAQTLGDRRLEGALLGSIGLLHSRQGRLEQALSHYEAAATLCRAHGSGWEVGSVLGNIGLMHSRQGRLEQALSHYEEALAIHRRYGNTMSEGMVLSNIGKLYRRQGALDQALECYREALALCQKSRNRHPEGVLMGAFGAIYSRQGQIDLAVEHYDRALQIHRTIGNKRSEGITLANLGTLHAAQGQHGVALEHYTQALAIVRHVRNKRSEGVILVRMGMTHLRLGAHELADTHLQQSIQICDALYPQVGGVGRAVLAQVRALQGDLGSARQLLQQAETMLRSGTPERRMKLLCATAFVEHRLGDVPAARTALAQVEQLVATGQPVLHPEQHAEIEGLRALLRP